MTTFSAAVQAVSLVALGSLLVYTLALVRMGRLSAHLIVSWIVAELLAIIAVLLWGRLPLMSFTSSLGNRELLVVLAVVSFSFIAYLMLDSLQRISQQSAQITRLAQEFALLRAETTRPALDHALVEPLLNVPDMGVPRTEEANTRQRVSTRRDPGLLAQLALAAWLVLCFVLYVVQGYFTLPAFLHHLLLAAHKQ